VSYTSFCGPDTILVVDGLVCGEVAIILIGERRLGEIGVRGTINILAVIYFTLEAVSILDS
jgi:hypothetical protein